MMTLARTGGVVSPVTSYLAIEPGVRPSTEGLDWGNGIGDSFGAAGFGLTGIGEGGGGAGEPAHQTTLSELFADAAARCDTTKAAHVTIETTFAEIVDVAVRVRGDDAAERARCLREAVWETELPSDFTRAHASESVDL
jgi:hypothetical protein